MANTNTIIPTTNPQQNNNKYKTHATTAQRKGNQVIQLNQPKTK